MRRFVRIDLDHVPDETTTCWFRHSLDARDLTKTICQATEDYLSERGLKLSEGMIVDANLIEALSSTKNAKHERAEGMKQTKKDNQWHFGMKTHIGTDTQGRVYSVMVTDA